MFKPDLELREKVFRKMGWKKENEFLAPGPYKDIIDRAEHLYNWAHPTIPKQLEELPPLETSWEVCAEYLVPWMRRKKYQPLAGVNDIGEEFFRWFHENNFNVKREVLMQGFNIPLAACQAFMEVEL